MTLLTCALLTCALLLSGCSGKSQDLAVPPARADLAEPAGLAWWSRAAMDAYMRFCVWRGAKSGFIVLSARDGVPVYGDVAGWKDIASGEPMTMATPVRIASMTKPITAVAAMILVEEGRLGLDDPVSKYLPEFGHLRVATSEVSKADGAFVTVPATTVLTVRHLLTFTSGMGPGRDKSSPLARYWEEYGIYEQPGGDLATRVTALAQLPLFDEPGKVWRYGYSADVLARVIEKVSGQSISDFMQSRILQQKTVDNMHRLHVPGGVLLEEGIQGLGWGLGMAVVADADATIIPDRTGDFWWSGYYGTVFFVSPATGLTGVILSQNEPGVFSGRPVEIFILQGLAFAGL